LFLHPLILSEAIFQAFLVRNLLAVFCFIFNLLLFKR
jgi:hypothetical protein